MPINSKPRTMVVNSRCDIRSIATIHSYLASVGYGNLNLSQTLRNALDNYADVLVANKLVEPFLGTFAAAEYLDSIRMTIPDGNRKSLIEQIQRETLIADGFVRPNNNVPLHGQEQPRKVTKSTVEKARQIMEERKVAPNPKTPAPETLDEAQQRRDSELEEFKQNLAKPPESS